MNIPTAEEWLSNNKEMSVYDVASHDEGGYLGIDEKALYKIMNEYAKFHVEAARKEFKMVFSEIDDVYPFMKDDKLSDIYPLTNIK